MGGCFVRHDRRGGGKVALMCALLLVAAMAAPVVVRADEGEGQTPPGSGAAVLEGTAFGGSGATAPDGGASSDGDGSATDASGLFGDGAVTLGDGTGVTGADSAGSGEVAGGSDGGVGSSGDGLAASDDAAGQGVSEGGAGSGASVPGADAPKASATPDANSGKRGSDEADSQGLQAMADVVAQGTCGTNCLWSIDSDGLLHIWVTRVKDARIANQSVYPWRATYSLQQKIKKVYLDSGVLLPTYCGALFEDCTNLTEVRSADWGKATSGVTNMSRMFKSCHSLKTLDVSKWDTSQVTTMKEMFNDCLDLTSLNVASWNTGKVTNMYGLFSGCESLGSINVSRWNTGNVTTMEYMFFYCKSLKSLTTHYLDDQGIRRWWDTSKVTNMGAMFASCTSLAGLNASRWDTSNVKSLYGIFAWCTSLDTVDLWSWNTSKATDLQIMFDECKSIKTFIVGKNFDVSTAFPHGTYDVTNTTKETIQGKTREVTRHYSWWLSKVSSGTFAREDVMKKRRGIGDTYTCLNRRPLSISTVSGISNQAFKGAPVKLVPTLKYKGTTLKQGTDYTLKYESCDKPGTAKLTITGKGSYVGSITKTYKLTWYAATRLPVSATSDYAVERGYWLRIRRGDGSFTFDDGTIKIASAGSGKVRITALRPGTSTICLTDGKGNVICSKNLTVYDIEGRDWELQSVLSKNLVLDIRRRSKDNGKEMIVWTRNNQTNQRYRFERQSDGSYAIKCKHSGKYVDVKYGGTKKSQPVIQWSWNGRANQRWSVFVNVNNSVTFISKKSGMCFDVKGGKVQAGAAMIQYPFKDGSNQKWVLNAK